MIGPGRVIQTTARKVAMLTIKPFPLGKLVYTPCCLKPPSHLDEYIFIPIVYDREKCSNREQSETNCIDENTMFIQIFTNVFPIILRFTMTVSEYLQTNEAG